MTTAIQCQLLPQANNQHNAVKQISVSAIAAAITHTYTEAATILWEYLDDLITDEDNRFLLRKALLRGMTRFVYDNRLRNLTPRQKAVATAPPPQDHRPPNDGKAMISPHRLPRFLHPLPPLELRRVPPKGQRISRSLNPLRHHLYRNLLTITRANRRRPHRNNLHRPKHSDRHDTTSN